MKQVIIYNMHPFFDDFDRCIAEANVPPGTPVKTLMELAKKWYNYNIILDDTGQIARIVMTDAEYTMWMIRWGHEI